jgi:hypothetical protein
MKKKSTTYLLSHTCSAMLCVDDIVRILLTVSESSPNSSVSFYRQHILIARILKQSLGN